MRYTHEKRFGVDDYQERIAVINRIQSTNKTRTQQVKNLQLGYVLRDDVAPQYYN